MSIAGVELETPVTDPPAQVVDPPVADPPAPEPPPEQAAPDAPVEEPPPAPEPRGAVKELIELRREVKELRTIAQDPALRQLTPELRQAIAEGRILVGPPAGSREAEAQRLSAVAEKFGLMKPDGTGPDLEAARRVDSGIRDTVREEMRPVQEMTLRDKAAQHVAQAIAFAEANGYDVDTIRNEYATVMALPNGAQALSQPQFAEQVWFSAVGKAVSAGKVPKPKAAAPAAEPPTRVAPIPPTPGGRRAPGSSPIQLDPGIAAVYAAHKVDPNKGADPKTITRTPRGGVEL